MWNQNDFTRLVGIEWPIVVAPMAGGPSTPELVAAGSNAGALGSFAAGYLPPASVREAVREIRRRTARPFAVNFFAPSPLERPPSPAEVERAQAALRPFRDEAGLGPPPAPSGLPRLEDQLDAALSEGFAVLSFTFGVLPPSLMERARRAGVILLGTATHEGEADLLEAAGVHAVVAQGAEAGGHRGTFVGPPERGLIGTMALVPRLVRRVKVPVVASGGIGDGRGVAAALALGASAAQLGTAFLASAESGASAPYKRAVATPSEDDRTGLTRAFSGRLARGLRNRFMERMEGQPVLPYPLQNSLTQDLRQAAARTGNPELLSLWAGQGPAPRQGASCSDIILSLVRETEAALGSLR
ncbi:MAG TPA: nitronate monooxygenase [Anaeromyxobacteraceae bacterium]|nr:nitronate monooxygenase [Anaeromyxobacteraceae bacterium]